MIDKLLFFVFIFAFAYLIYKYSWKLQLHYGGFNTLYTPETFPIVNEEKYNIQIRKGISEMKNSKVIIAGLLRDVENQLPDIKQKLYNLVPNFQDYAILLVENDSSDNTRKLLLDMTKNDPKIHILGCGVNVDKCSLSLEKTIGHSVPKKRIDKMTMLRNIYMDYIKSSAEYAEYDYLIVWDLDLIGNVYLDGIYNSFGYFRDDKNIDCICANGIYRWLGFMTIYYDTFAHLDWDDKFNISEKFKHDIKKGLTVRADRGEGLRHVRSCFSGFAIYKLRPIIDNNLKYEYTSENELLCEHTTLNDKLSNIYMNPSLINYVIRNE